MGAPCVAAATLRSATIAQGDNGDSEVALEQATLAYTKIHGYPEADMQRYFKTSPPAIHQMVVNLEKRGLITKVSGQARSLRLLISRDKLPDLE